MNLNDVLNGLELVKCGYNNALYGNDEGRTMFIKNITKDIYNSLINFNLENLDKDLFECGTYEEYKASKIIKDYIIPEMDKAKKRYKEYGF